MVQIPIGEWLPDLPENQNPGALLAKNCIPLDQSYTQFEGLAPFANALASSARGSFWLRSNAGTLFNFAGDANNLYLFDGATAWNNVNKPATVYSSIAWDFVNFQDRVIATDGGASNIQYFDAGVSTKFDDLPGGPPRGRVVGVVRDFVLIGNYAIGAEVEAGGLAWCGFNNTNLWTPSLSTQSGRRRTRGVGGKVQRIVSGSQGLVFRENAMLLVSYVGAPNVFQVDDVTTLHGTPAPRSVAWTKDMAFYYANEGFHQINRRSLKIDPIGIFRVDEWFKANSAPADVVNMIGVVNRSRTLVYWAFRSSGSSPTFDRILVFNWAANNGRGKWGYAELAVEFIGEFANVGYNLDTIGAILGGNIDSASIPVDSAAYAGGALSIIGFNPSHIANTFNGPALTAEIDTTELAADEDKRQFVRDVRPFVEGAPSSTIQVAALGRNKVQDNPMLGPFATLNAETGLAYLRTNARYLRYRIKVTGGFDHVRAVAVSPIPRGKR